MKDQKQSGAVSDLEKRLMEKTDTSRVGKGAISDREMRMMKKDSRPTRNDKRK
jgi:hypothetical protein